ncbi:hypothetical protein LK09_03965 [Microbacterium mangrovi]|uniref:Prepilin-type N-terminal cleavage/methylation domain-containing protein n=1 Tax=Microbacterium mangrovi TaxID=1348253 RepID=A0A0B2AC09_9MICO|nr:prepilin-type N-terminal cleavage/methylation domain-containing protein [Microbacterium mangrovi]KHK99171.1 hypothetical protein LK09_03965 [Microbacterium mangrovi]
MRDLERDDGGFSLVELIIYVVVLGVITAGIAVMFVNIWKTQASVTDQTDATARGQVISSQIEKAMRNAVAFKVTDAGLSSTLATGPVLEVATDLSGSNACMGFNLGGGSAQLAMTSGGALSSASWRTWEPGVVQHYTDDFFTQSGTTVSYSFDVKSANGPTVHFQGTAYMRNITWGALPGGGTQTCFT